MAVCLCSHFFSMSDVTVATTTLLVTVMCSIVLTTAPNVTVTASSVGLAEVLGQHDVALQPLLILRDTIRMLLPLLLCCSSNLSPRYLLRHMPVMPWVLLRSLASHWFPDLVPVTVFAFCLQVPVWLPCSLMGAWVLGFALLQSFGVYPCETYVLPHAGPWLTPRVHWVAAPSAALNMEGASDYSVSCPVAIQSTW